MTPEAALERLRRSADPAKAVQSAKYHRARRVCLGVPNPVLTVLAQEWRRTVSLPDRLVLADGLWSSDIHEARVLAAKLLEQARIRPDDVGAWNLIQSWVPDFDAWAIADHVCMAGQKRLVAQPSRVEAVEVWVGSDQMWTRRAALVITLPWARVRSPSAGDLAIRERVLGWCEALVPDQAWFIQKAIGWWLRELSSRDPDRVRAFLAGHGGGLKAFARREAVRRMEE